MRVDREQRYLSGNPSLSPDLIRTASAQEVSELQRKIRSRIREKDASGRDLMALAHKVGRIIRSFYLNANVGLEKLSDLVNKDSEVYLVWDDFLDVDHSLFWVICSEFHNIWYSEADDLDIFDKEGDWAILIRHDGYLRFVDFRPEAGSA